MNDTPTPQPTVDHDPARAHQLDVLRLSAEQVRAKVAMDVIRLVDPQASKLEYDLYHRAAAYLLLYFGGTTVGKFVGDDYEGGDHGG